MRPWDPSDWHGNVLLLLSIYACHAAGVVCCQTIGEFIAGAGLEDAICTDTLVILPIPCEICLSIASSSRLKIGSLFSETEDRLCEVSFTDGRRRKESLCLSFESFCLSFESFRIFGDAACFFSSAEGAGEIFFSDVGGTEETEEILITRMEALRSGLGVCIIQK